MTTASGQKLLLVRPTSFSMGAPRREPGRRANERQRTVIMKRPFYLAEKLVTNKAFRQFKATHQSGTISGYSLDNDNHPVVNISWDDCVEYLNWLSVRDKLSPFYIKTPTGFVPASPPTNGYRLPTEAEWAFAARKLGNNALQRFPWGQTFPPRTVLGNYADISAINIVPRILDDYNDSFTLSSPVGFFPANSGGFFDMGGNVSEWCHDFYTASVSSLSTKSDPMGPASGTHRVVRGSSWRDSAITELRLSYRSYSQASRDSIGFRVARYQ